MAPQLDGTSKTKPSTSSTTPRTGFRKRIMNLFCTKKPSEPDEYTGDEEIDDTSPMRMISPRATGFDPSTPQPKRRTFSFRGRQSKSPKSPTPGATIGPLEAKQRDIGANDVRPREVGGSAAVHVPVTDMSVTKRPFQSPIRGQMQSRIEGRVTSLPAPGTPASLTKEAALTSHPILKECDGEEKFETPISEKESEATGYVGKK